MGGPPEGPCTLRRFLWRHLIEHPRGLRKDLASFLERLLAPLVTVQGSSIFLSFRWAALSGNRHYFRDRTGQTHFRRYEDRESR